MKFSRRTNWPSHENELSRTWREIKDQKEPAIDLTASNPTRCGFSFPQAEILAAFDRPDNMTYQPDPLGLYSARQAVSRYYARQGISVDPQQIILTASTSEAYSLLFRLLTDAGDHVLFPRPSYPLFGFLADLNDLELRYYDLAFQERWLLDQRSLDEVWQADTRAAVMVNPNNPTGSYLDQTGLSAILSRARHYQTPLICDEVFSDFSFSENNHSRSLAGTDDVLTFVLSGLSKVLGLPQMKLSWIIVSGPADVKREALQRLEIMADTYLSVNTPSQQALTAWLDLAPEIQARIRTRLKNNLQALQTTCSRPPGVQVLTPEGGWYAVLKVRDGLDEENFCLRLLREQRVFVHPGYFFDFLTTGHLVVSLLGEETVFRAGVSSLIRELSRV